MLLGYIIYNMSWELQTQEVGETADVVAIRDRNLPVWLVLALPLTL